MRPIWKGSINFSLITIPIALYPASRREELSFRMLRASDLSPINFKRVAENDGREVPWEQIVKGYEYEQGKFVVLKDEDFQRADTEATQTIDIMDFVKLDEINPIYFDKPYYLVPEKGGAKAYALLRDALKRTARVGIAKVVIKTRQHLAAIKPQDNAVMLELMHFDEELIEPSNLEIPKKSDVGGKELNLATDLVEKMAGEWKPEKYIDNYQQALLALIQKKIARGGKSPPSSGGKTKRPGNIVDLAAVLKESLARTHSPAARKREKAQAHKGKKRAA